MGMNDFEHERLDVYRTAIEFLVVADEIATNLPKGRAYLADQLRRAATSIPLNIAEGAGEFSPGTRRGSIGWRAGRPPNARRSWTLVEPPILLTRSSCPKAERYFCEQSPC